MVTSQHTSYHDTNILATVSKYTANGGIALQEAVPLLRTVTWLRYPFEQEFSLINRGFFEQGDAETASF